MRLVLMLAGLLSTLVLPLNAQVAVEKTPPVAPTSAPAAPTSPVAATTASTAKDFELPSFMRKEGLSVSKNMGAKLENQKTQANSSLRDSTTDFQDGPSGNAKGNEELTGGQPSQPKPEVVPNAGDFVNKMSVGDIIVSPRQKLLHQGLADIRMEEVQIRDALRYLAEAAGINYVLPDLDTDKVTVNMRMPPFKAMEILANNFGLGIYEEDGLWFIRKKDKASYFAKIYKLKNIHLGDSTSGAGTTTTTNSDGTTTNSNGTTTTNGTTTNGTTTSTGTTTGTVSSSSSSGGQVVMTTLQEILGIDVDFGGTMNADGTMSTSMGSQSNTTEKKDSNTTTAADNTYVSYDADANTLFIIATATQHQWAEQYLQAIDNPTSNIAIEAMFLESSRTPDQIFGVDWAKANTVTIKPTGGSAAAVVGPVPATGSTTTSNLMHLPFGGIMTASDLAWGLQVFKSENDGQIASYPSVVTQNGREVKIETTQKVPLSSLQHNVSTDTTTSVSVGVQDLGTQQIGTTITITPHQINKDLIQLKISIKISTGDGEKDVNTGRVTTNESSYDGVVNVPTGCTLAIGGLEHIDEKLIKSGMPLAQDIPLFGFMFKRQETKVTRSNIFLFITPTALDQNSADGIFMKKTEGLSRDWVEKADDMHRAWRRRTVDPMVEKTIKEENKR